ncbi:fasciclin domain-containing protein [Flavobacterium sp.]|uniref:fasciclin domain-containing protein n=1 Tax=Flavobacterium sp. TaxID=239 RepID=UPI0037538BDF
MKHFKILKKFFLLSAFILVVTSMISCSSEEEINAKKSTITGIVQSQSGLSTFGVALQRTNLLTTLDASGTYTVFAPTNLAFDNFLALYGFASINDVPTATLKEILLNHVIGQSLKSIDLPASGYITTMATGSSSTNKLSMYVNKSSGVVLNDVAEVKNADVLASNGIIHIVDAVIGLPTVFDHIIANPNLTSLVGVLTGTGQPDYPTILSGTGPFTVFAPVNTAFVSLNTEIAGGVPGVSAANMTKLLNYHVTAAAFLTTNLTEGQIINSLQSPQTFTVLLSGGPKVKDVNNRVSNITTPNIQCSNGVVHLTNKVMLPTF